MSKIFRQLISGKVSVIKILSLTALVFLFVLLAPALSSVSTSFAASPGISPSPGIDPGLTVKIPTLTISSARADPSIFRDNTKISATFSYNNGPFSLEYATVKFTKLSTTSQNYNMGCLSGCGTDTQVWQTATIDTTNNNLFTDGQWKVMISAKVMDCSFISCSRFTSIDVTIDKTAPEGQVTINNDEPYTNTKTATLSVTCDDKGGSGCASNVDYQTEATSGTVPISNTISGISLGDSQGSQKVTMKLRDILGNSREVSDTIIFDSIAPSVSAEKPTPNGVGWYNKPVTIQWKGDDTGGSGIKDCTTQTYNGAEGEDIAVTGSCTDNAGNVGTGEIRIKYDNTPPEVKVPTEISVSAVGQNGGPATFDVTATDMTSGVDGQPSCDKSSGSTFPIGPTIVHCTARDKAGNEATGEFTVKVNAPGAPTLTVPTEPIEAVAGVDDLAQVDYATKVSAKDDKDGTLTPTCTPASGTKFSIGDTTVKCNAINSAGVVGESTFIVRVTASVQQLSVTVTSDSDKFVAGQDNIKVKGKVTGKFDPGTQVQLQFYDSVGTIFASTSADLQNDGMYSHTLTKQIPLEGVPFGEWKVTAQYNDVKSQPAVFKVLKKGITQLTVPSEPIPAVASGDNGAIVNYMEKVSAIDSEEGKLLPTCSPASGTPFSVGETIVKCSVTSAAGNHVEKSFPITVKAANSTATMDPMILYGIIGVIAAAALVGTFVASAKIRKKKADMNVP